MTELTDRLQDLWSQPGKDPAIWHHGRWYNWHELTVAADAVSALMGAAGHDADARVVVGLENQPGVIASLLAGMATGRRLRFVNAMQSTQRLAEDLADLDPTVLVVTATLRERLAPLHDTVRIIELGPGSSVRMVAPGHVPEAVGTPEGEADAGSLELFTSGTTGPPKRITLRRSQIESTLAAVFASYGDSARPSPTPKSPALVATPIAHIGGLWGVLQSLVTARPCVLLERFGVEEWIDAVRTHQPRTAGLPPAALRMVYEANVPPQWLSSLRALVVGTAPIEPDFIDAFVERYGIAILNIYGATEFTGAVAGWSLPMFTTYWSTKRGSVGRAQPGVQMRVVDAHGDPVGVGEPGVLQLKSVQTGHSGWVHTSDRARIDADGFVWIDGRTDDMINRGGFKIDPAVVRSTLESHPSVAEAAVVPLDDDRLGQVPVAAVCLNNSAPPVNAETLREFCRAALTPYQVPARVLVVGDLPRTAAMKVSAREVIEMFEPAQPGAAVTAS